eukprot:CAMPEP_0184871110 /NCGR_PEP_ID=MMETSP0580-20130426/39947_1 /TAXON_ID=1118495 /ORGANISM="Dactyliosolen fragilissimus" /LENGTH=186 /DNA_ID=CAMNT_0027373619 /DNA_START=88 /DNA_END=649 /DNA_ORIENTATION=+
MALRGSIDGDVTQPIRRVEDVEYWRKRAGWFDDDASMKDYNRGVYDSYFSIDDDDSSGGYSGNKKELLKSVAQFVGVFIALAFLILIIGQSPGLALKSLLRVKLAFLLDVPKANRAQKVVPADLVAANHALEDLLDHAAELDRVVIMSSWMINLPKAEVPEVAVGVKLEVVGVKADPVKNLSSRKC